MVEDAQPSTTPKRPRSHVRAAVRWFGLAILILASVRVYGFRTTTELAVYMRAAERMVVGEGIYRLDEGLPPFAYPPAFSLVMTPLAPLSWTSQRVAWSILLTVLAVWLVRMLWTVIAPRLDRTQSPRITGLVFWILFTLVGIRHLVSPLENQSHDLMIAVLVTGTALAGGRRRDSLAGVFAGVGAGLKATPLLFLPTFLLQRRWMASFAMFIALGVALIAPDMIMPRGDGGSNLKEWVGIASGAAQPGSSGGDVIWEPWNHLNQNLAGTVYRLTAAPRTDVGPDVSFATLSDSQRKLLTLGLQGMVGLSVLFFGGFLGWSRRCDAADLRFVRLAQAGVIGCGMILLSPMSSKAHYCVLLIGIAVVACDCVERRRWSQAVLLGLMILLGTLTTKGLLGKTRGDTMLALGAPMWSCVLLLIACSSTLWTRTRPQSSVG